MQYKSINEIEQFSFQDCEMISFKAADSQIQMVLEAVLVMPGNSQNPNYTMSYARTTNVRLQKARILSAVKDGYKYYDADGVLMEEVPDTPLSEDEINGLSALFANSYFYAMNKLSEDNSLFTYCMHVEIPIRSEDEYDNTVQDSYTLEVSFENAIFEWDSYLNKAQL